MKKKYSMNEWKKWWNHRKLLIHKVQQKPIYNFISDENYDIHMHNAFMTDAHEAFNTLHDITDEENNNESWQQF